MRVVHRDVDRAVAPFRETADRAPVLRRDRAVAVVDRADEVARDERLPAFVLPDPVRPFLVGERAGRAERHHEDGGSRAVQRDELVLDDAHTDGLEERARPAGHTVQQVEDRVATRRVPGVAGREVDVDRLASSAECRARHVEARRGALDLTNAASRGGAKPRYVQ